MMRESITAPIRSSVAENSVCWCEGRRVRSRRLPKLREAPLAPGAAGDGIRVRFYTAAIMTNCKDEYWCSLEFVAVEEPGLSPAEPWAIDGGFSRGNRG